MWIVKKQKQFWTNFKFEKEHSSDNLWENKDKKANKYLLKTTFRTLKLHTSGHLFLKCYNFLLRISNQLLASDFNEKKSDNSETEKS